MLYISSFFNPTPFVFFKDISCFIYANIPENSKKLTVFCFFLTTINQNCSGCNVFWLLLYLLLLVFQMPLKLYFFTIIICDHKLGLRKKNFIKPKSEHNTCSALFWTFTFINLRRLKIINFLKSFPLSIKYFIARYGV